MRHSSPSDKYYSILIKPSFHVRIEWHITMKESSLVVKQDNEISKTSDLEIDLYDISMVSTTYDKTVH